VRDSRERDAAVVGEKYENSCAVLGQLLGKHRTLGSLCLPNSRKNSSQEGEETKTKNIRRKKDRWNSVLRRLLQKRPRRGGMSSKKQAENTQVLDPREEIYKMYVSPHKNGVVDNGPERKKVQLYERREQRARTGGSERSRVIHLKSHQIIRKGSGLTPRVR